jgi:hypothetical protein
MKVISTAAHSTDAGAWFCSSHEAVCYAPVNDLNRATPSPGLVDVVVAGQCMVGGGGRGAGATVRQIGVAGQRANWVSIDTVNVVIRSYSCQDACTVDITGRRFMTCSLQQFWPTCMTYIILK